MNGSFHSLVEVFKKVGWKMLSLRLSQKWLRLSLSSLAHNWMRCTTVTFDVIMVTISFPKFFQKFCASKWSSHTFDIILTLFGPLTLSRFIDIRLFKWPCGSTSRKTQSILQMIFYSFWWHKLCLIWSWQ